MIQMITGLIVVGLLGNILRAEQMQKALRRQHDEQATEADDQAGGR